MMVTTASPHLRLPPRLGGGLPWLGHALEFHRAPVGLLERGQRRLGDVFSFKLANKLVHVLTGPAANESFFRASDDQLSAREAYQFTVPIFGKGIAYDVAADRFDEQLGFVFPALRESRLQSYARVMLEEAEGYFEAWGDSGEVDLLNAMNELTIFIASRCLVGREFRDNMTTEFAQLYHDLEGGINLVAFLKPDFPRPAHRRRDRARVRMVELISQIIRERRRSNIPGEDFLQTLIEARYADGTSLTDDNITGLLLTLIFAGQHTSAVLATWAGILLLQHRSFLPPVLEEQQELLAADAEMTLAALKQMHVLERTIKEAERMHPPLIMLMRKIMQDFRHGDFTMPAGDLALVSPALSHRLPDVFSDPDRYDPDRFACGREEDRKSSYRLIGFGGGKHRCIGTAFAYQQIKVIWSFLLRHFDLELPQTVYRPNYATFVVGPRQPCMVRYQRKKVAGLGSGGSSKIRLHNAC